MMAFKITDKVTWVGKIDWDLETFHGEEYSTHKGSTYNAYLIQDDKTVLIDTVWTPFKEEFVAELKKVISLEKIDYIVMNHGEADHSGALPELMRLIPDTPIYCTANGVKSLKGQYHKDWDFRVVKTGEKLSLGTRDLLFIEAPMLHWPDSMFCYLTGDDILFSNDAFGQHYATELMYNDLVDKAELDYECIKYYANILTPFSRLVTRKIQEFIDLNLPVSFICPSHGVIWRENPLQIVEQYNVWANSYQENQITIMYDTMWDGTKKMANAIAQGIKAANPSLTIKLYHIANRDRNDVLTEVFKSKAIFLGSPTVNRTILSTVAAMIEAMKGLGFTNKKAAAFGTYGWSGEAIKVISARLEDAGFEVINPGIRGLYNPDEGVIEQCYALGEEMVRAINL